MAGADLALITLDDRGLGVMSPSKLHANLAAGLPVVYVGPEGSNVDEAIRALRRGPQPPARRRRRASWRLSGALAADDDGPRAAPGRRSRSTTATRPSLPAFDRLLDG